MSPVIAKIDLFGTQFPVLWHSDDQRRFSDQETCYSLVSFDGLEQHDQERFGLGLPRKIEKCWLINPDYKPDPVRDRLAWQRAGGKCPPLVANQYYPPEARAVPRIDPKNVNVGKSAMTNTLASLAAMSIVKASCHSPVSGGLSALLCKPGAPAFLAIFENDDFLFLRAVAKCPMPLEAMNYFRSTSLQASFARVVEQSKAANANLAETRAKLQKAEEVASLTLEEALQKWMRFDPSGMKANTKARIEKAVKDYMTDPNKHSLGKIAREFRVSRKTVSVWFNRFTKETGFRVVRFSRHEAVKDHLRAELQFKRQQREVGESCDEGEIE